MQSLLLIARTDIMYILTASSDYVTALHISEQQQKNRMRHNAASLFL